jgi:NAD(P)-dependent dehydrogenase (short-subunit alcohol dehydrogenase family)
MFARIAQRYQNTTVVVIGAGGIGSAIAKLLAASVGQLVVADRDEGALQKLADACKPASVLTRTVDVRDAAAIPELFEFIARTAGAPDYLFYAAGILNVEPLAETSSETWDRSVGINLSGAFYCMQAALEQMRPRRRGSILFLGSIAGTKARSGSRVNPVYNATKAGLAAMVNAAAMQLRSFGVRINCISPGPTATTMMDLQSAQVHAAVNDIALDGRMNSSIEVAELALFVAAHGRFTGEDVCMGGGAGLGG